MAQVNLITVHAVNNDAVAAIVYGAPGDPVTAEVISAVREQTRPPGELITDAGGLSAAAAAAAGITSGWLWLLDGGAIPEPHALEALLDASRQDPAPVLLSSRLLGPDGDLDPGSLPRHVIYATDVSVAAAEHRLVQIRAARSGSVLVRRHAVLGLGRRGSDMFRLSARVLRDPAHIGYLVPRSVATRRRPLGTDLISEVRTLGGDAWAPREKLREAFRVGRRLPGFAGASHRGARER